MDRQERAQAAAGLLVAGQSPSPEEYLALRSEIAGFLLSSWPWLGSADVEDTTAEAIARFMKVRDKAAESVSSDKVLAYLMGIVRNVQVENFRARRDLPVSQVLEDRAIPDDQVAAMISKETNLAVLREVVARLSAAQDTTTLQVLVEWLDHAQTQGTEPSNRTIAETLGVSHTTVARALQRFRAEVDRVRQREEQRDGHSGAEAPPDARPRRDTRRSWRRNQPSRSRETNPPGESTAEERHRPRSGNEGPEYR